MSVNIKKNGILTAEGTGVKENLIPNFTVNKKLNWSCAGSGWGAIEIVECDISLTGYAFRSTFTGEIGVVGGPYRGSTDYLSSIVNGEIYTLSAFIRASKNINMNIRSEMMTSYSLPQPTLVTTEWKRYVVSGPVNTENTYKATVFYASSGGQVENGTWIEVCMPKLELGSFATPWIPAVSDNILSEASAFYENQIMSSVSFGRDHVVANTFYEI